MNGKLIVFGFTGIGKSTFAEKYPQSIDIDSSTIPKTDDWVLRYRDQIVTALDTYDYVLVSSHSLLRDVMTDLPCVLVYPSVDQLDDYCQRFLQRGDGQWYADQISALWTPLLTEFDTEKRYPRIVLRPGEFLADYYEQLELIRKACPRIF